MTTVATAATRAIATVTREATTIAEEIKRRLINSAQGTDAIKTGNFSKWTALTSQMKMIDIISIGDHSQAMI